MYNILILVADQSHARLYGTETVHSTPVEMEGFSNAVGKNREQDFVSDAPGKAMGPAGTYPHPMGREQEARHHNLEVYAKSIMSELERQLRDAPGTALYLIAGPRLLGILRSKLTPAVEKHIAGELNKELTDIKPAELPGYIRIINTVQA